MEARGDLQPFAMDATTWDTHIKDEELNETEYLIHSPGIKATRIAFHENDTKFQLKAKQSESRTCHWY